MTFPPETLPEIPFDPVPAQRRRRGGWTAERQRAFIASLAQCGSVSLAAKSVGLSPRSAYALLDREGSDSFGEAWDLAVAMGMDAMREAVMDRAMHGAWVPVTRRGEVVGKRFCYFDKLAIAVLSGGREDIFEQQDYRAHRRAFRRDLRAHDRRLAEEAAAKEALRIETERQLAQIAEQEAERRRQARRPRITVF